MLEIDAFGEHDSLFPLPASRKAAGPQNYRLVVYGDGNVQYHVSQWKSCTPDCPNFGWLYRWDDSHEQVFSGTAEPAEMDRLKALINGEGKNLGSYANQGPQVGDFQILIYGANGQQSGSVVFGLQPAWSISRPYVDLICKGKSIAQRLTASASIPDWCTKSNQ